MRVPPHLYASVALVMCLICAVFGARFDPLPDRHLGQHAINQMRGGLRHPASAARRTEAAALARQRDQAIVAAVISTKSREAVRQDAAAQECSELLHDEPGWGSVSVVRAREEALELLADDLAKEGLLRRTALVLGHEVPFRDQRAASAASKVGAIDGRGIVALPPELESSSPRLREASARRALRAHRGRRGTTRT